VPVLTQNSVMLGLLAVVGAGLAMVALGVYNPVATGDKSGEEVETNDCPSWGNPPEQVPVFRLQVDLDNAAWAGAPSAGVDAAEMTLNRSDETVRVQSWNETKAFAVLDVREARASSVEAIGCRLGGVPSVELRTGERRPLGLYGLTSLQPGNDSAMLNVVYDERIYRDEACEKVVDGERGDWVDRFVWAGEPSTVTYTGDPSGCPSGTIEHRFLGFWNLER